MKVLFNEERALHVFRTLAALWQSQKGIYREELLPQNLYELPEDPKERANFLFFGAIPMRGAVNSDDPFQIIRRLYEKFPGMFNPFEVVSSWSITMIADAFLEVVRELKEERTIVGQEDVDVQVGAASMSYNFEDHVNCWYHNARTLAWDWNGDIRNVYAGVGEFEEAFDRIAHRELKRKRKDLTIEARESLGFIGMRRKIFALLTIWLQEKNLIARFRTPIPVDFHALCRLWGTGIISFEDLGPFVPRTRKQKRLGIRGRLAVYTSEKVVDQITWWSQDFFTRHDMNHMDINPALWVLNRQMCAFHPQTRMQRPLKTQAATKREALRRRRRSRLKPKRTSGNARRDGMFLEPEVLQDISAWPRNHRNECALCPLENVCTGVMPAGIYYRTSFLVWLRRAHYPQGHVLGDLRGSTPEDVGDIPLRGRKRNPKERVPVQAKPAAAVLQMGSNGHEPIQKRLFALGRVRKTQSESVIVHAYPEAG